MNIAVVGTGNVGSALLIHLAMVEEVDQVLVMDLEPNWSRAAVMDVASANPAAAARCRIAAYRELDRADVIVLTSGAQMAEHETGQDVHEKNLRITNDILDQAVLAQDAIVIALATPVDAITAHIQQRYDRPSNLVLGFGGDLDCNRLIYTLRRRGYDAEQAGVVGEHGAQVIPYYPSEHSYDEVAHEVRTFLKDITAQGGRPRNLATGLLLARLIDDLIHDRGRVHFVCGRHPKYDRYLTWPFEIRRTGVGDPLKPHLGERALQALEQYLAEGLKTH
jgi:malate/lactate dehydrogenase